MHAVWQPCSHVGDEILKHILLIFYGTSQRRQVTLFSESLEINSKSKIKRSAASYVLHAINTLLLHVITVRSFYFCYLRTILSGGNDAVPACIR